MKVLGLQPGNASAASGLFVGANGVFARAAGNQASSGDADAAAFIAAGGITNPTQITAINQIFADLKAAGIYTKLYGAWLFTGPTDLSQCLNMVNPQDSDGAYRLTPVGAGYTFDSNGWNPNGGGYLNTHLNGSSVLSKTNSHYSFYSRTNISNGSSDYGALSGANCEVYTRNAGTLYQDIPDYNGGADRISAANTNSQGFYNGCMGATNLVIYKNGVSFAAKGSAAAGNYANSNMLFSTGSSPPDAATRNLAFASIGQALTAGEAAAFYTAVQAFNTTLSRQV